MPRTQQDPRSSSPQIAGKSRGLVATVVVLLAAPSLLPGVDRAQSEDQVKAAFLFHFARYVEWPASAFEEEGAPVRICLFGSGRFESVVSGVVSGKRVEGRPVEVATTEDLAQAKSCHILIAGDQETQARSDVISMLGGFSVFTVSDAGGFARVVE